MYKYPITKSRNGRDVYVNLITSPAGRTIGRQPHMLHLIKEVIQAQNLKGDELSIEHDMGRIIGNTEVVKTSDKDSVFYAQPHKGNVFSRYVKNRSMTPSTTLTLILQKDEEGDYLLINTWVGPYNPPFPGDDKATTDSKIYWEDHALVVDLQAIQSKTITTVCPY